MTSGRVLVLGSINVDLLASVDRLPTAGETVAGRALSRQLGGKGANQAVSAARAGGSTTLLGAIGDDEGGAAMLGVLRDQGVATDSIARVPGPTGHALVVTSRRDNQIVVIAGANAQVDAAATRHGAEGDDVCLTQMETPPAAAHAFFEHGRAAGATTILNAAPADASVMALLPLTDILIVNESELALLSGVVVDGGSDDLTLIEAVERRLPQRVAAVIVTLGAQGVAIIRAGAVERVAGRAVEVVDTTGAGDCFCGYLAAAIARGDALETAVAEANVAASIAVQSLGAAASVPSRSQVLSALSVGQLEAS